MDNTELGKLVIKQIEAFPETFNMGTFGMFIQYGTECGTVACLAGHALLLSGYDLRPSTPGRYCYLRPDGNEVGIGSEARQLLGMRREEQALFYLSEDIAVPVFRALAEGSVLADIPAWRQWRKDQPRTPYISEILSLYGA
jgi:hypothetical protein